VKLQFSKVKKEYKNGNYVYEYGRISLHFPRRTHEILIPLRYRNLKLEITKKDRITNIKLIEQDDA